AMPRTRGSFHGGGRFGLSAPAVSLAMAEPPGRSADRRSVDQAAFGPEVVVAAFELERRAQAEMLVENLAVIADRLDCVVGPFLVESEGLAHSRRGAEDALDVRVLVLGHLVDILLGD